MQKTQKIDTRPAYFDGQLLNAEDFIAEQHYHRLARRQHNIHLHDWGVIKGLEVGATEDDKLTVQPGFAVDANGREIDLPNATVLDVSGMPAHAHLRVSLYYHRDASDRTARKHLDSHAVIDVSDGPGDKDALLLATLQLNGGGRIIRTSIDTGVVRRPRNRLAPGSVTLDALAPELRRGWVASPFRGLPLEKGPDDNKLPPPPFRIGTTEARTHKRWTNADNAQGAGGTMAITLPLGAKRLLQFRIAGIDNDKGIDFHLVRGGFDAGTNTHTRKILLESLIKDRPYNELYTIENGEIEPQYHTLALWVRGHGNASISLVAFEFSY
jgi:hypothetical protein